VGNRIVGSRSVRVGSDALEWPWKSGREGVSPHVHSPFDL